MDKQIKLQFQASATGLDDVYKKIQQITSKPDIKIGDKVAKDLQQLEIKLPAFMSQVTKMMENPNLSLFDLQSLDKEFKSLSKLLSGVVVDLNEVNLSDTIKKQVLEAQKEIDALTKSKTTSKNAIFGKKTKLKEGNEGGIAKTEQNKVFSSTIGSIDIGDKQVSSYDQFVKVLGEVEKAGTISAERLAELKKIQTELIDSFGRRRQEIENEIQAEQSSIDATNKKIKALQDSQAVLKESINSSEQLSETEKVNNQELIQIYEDLSNAKNKEAKVVSDAANQVKESEKAREEEDATLRRVTGSVEQNTTSQKKNTTTIGKAAKQVFTYGTLMSGFRKIYSTVTRTITELDKALTSMAVVTSMSREEAYELTTTFNQLGDATGKTSSQIAEIATKFYQQGKSTSQVIQLTEAAAKAATIAGIDGSRSVDLLTNAMNGFQMSANQAMEVSDKFAALAANAATDYEELATALSKVAAQANLAGMSMDFTLGLLTKGIEVTREAPETIGTALKTVVARMRELTDYGKTLEDGTDVNRVDKALQNVGVSLMDTNGEFRDLEVVITELGQKWDSLNKNQQANVAVALAGTRQQSRLIAMMQDFDRTLELVDISANSYGATLAQSADYMTGLEAAQTRLTNAMQGLVSSIVDTDWFIGILNGLTSAIQFVTENTWALIPVLTVIGGLVLTSLSAKLQEVTLNREQVTLKEKEALATAQKTLDEKQNLVTQQKAAVQSQKDLVDAIKKKKTIAEELKLYKEKLKDARLTSIEEDKSLSKAEKAAKKAEVELKYQTEAAALDVKTGKLASELAEAERDLKIEQQQLAIVEGDAKRQSLAVKQQELAVKKAENNEHLITGVLLNSINIFSQIGQALQAVALARQQHINRAKMDQLLKEKAITSEKQKQVIATVAQEKVEKKSAKTFLKNAMLKMAQSVASIPVVGWVIAAGILAAIGIAIAAAATDGFKQTEEDSLEETKENLKELQVELYNLNQSKSKVAGLSNEFDDLSSKVIKSAEEVQRLKEITQEFNDEAGFELISDADDYETALAKMKGYEQVKDLQIQETIKDMNTTIAEGYTNFLNTRWGTEEQKSKDYEKELATDSTMVAAVRSIASASLPGMEDVSQATKTLLTDMVVNSINEEGFEDVVTKDGLSVDAFVTALGGQNEYNALVKNLEETLTDGSFSAYANMWDNLDDQAKKLLSSSNPLFKAVETLGAETVRVFDNVGYSAEEMNILFEAAGDNLDEVMKNAQQSADWNSGSDLSLAEQAENRRLIYEQVAQERQASQEAMSVIVNATDEELEAMAKNGDAVAQEYLNAKTAVADADAQLLQAQKNLEEAEDTGKKTSKSEQKKIDEAQKDLQEATEASGTAISKLEEFNEIANGTNITLAEMESLLGIISADVMLDEIDKMTSSFERLAKAIDISNLGLRDQITLLRDYPELSEDITNGTITLGSIMEQYEENLDDLGATAAGNMDAIPTLYEEGWSKFTSFDELLGDNSSITIDGTSYDLKNIFNNDEAGATFRQAFVDKKWTIDDDVDDLISQIYDQGIKLRTDSYLQKYGKYDENNNWVGIQYTNTDGTTATYTEDYAKEQAEATARAEYTITDAQEWVTGLQSHVLEWTESALLKDAVTNATTGSIDYTFLMDETSKEQLEAAKSQAKYYQAIAEQAETQLEYLDKDSEAYLDTIKNRNVAYLNANENLEKDIAAQRQGIANQLKTEIKDTGIEYANVVKTINGTLYLDHEKIAKLEESKRETIYQEIDAIGLVIEELNNTAAAFDEMEQQIKDNNEALSEAYSLQLTEEINEQIELLEQQNEAYEEEIATLEKLQTAYDNYWSRLDALDSEMEAEQNRENLLRQLSSLSGGSGTATAELRKDLMSQLEELNQTQADELKQQQRDEITKNIESQTEQINTQIEANNAQIDMLNESVDQINDGVKVIAGLMGIEGSNYKFTPAADGTVILQKKDGDTWTEWSPYAEGGLVDYTGPAFVHGTPTAPEAFLSSVDTKNMQALMSALDYVMKNSWGNSTADADINASNVTVQIDKVDVHTDELNNNQDFASAGQIFATEFANAITRRGINLNVKK